MTTTTKPNTAFWTIAVLALLWNIIGVFLWASNSFLMTEETMAAFTPEQQQLMDSTPSWNTAVYGFATISALLACVCLLMRKKLAVALFGLSLIAVLIIQLYWVFIMDSVTLMGPQSIIVPLIVIAIAIFEYFYSKGAAQRGWIV